MTKPENTSMSSHDEIVIELRGKILTRLNETTLKESIPEAIDSNALANPPPSERDAECTHSDDYSTVTWHGKRYTFSGKQRLVVAVLWTHWLSHNPFVHADYLLSHAESDSPRLRDLFKRHPAWGTMIAQGILHKGPEGTYCLAKESD